MTSTDGVEWVSRPTGTQNPLSSVAYGNGQFVVVSEYRDVLSSTDGINWVQRPPSSESLNAIAYGNGHFVVARGHSILQSGSIMSLGINVRAGLVSLSLEGPTGLNYTIQTSTDLISWRNLVKSPAAKPRT